MGLTSPVRLSAAPVRRGVARREVAWGLLSELAPGVSLTNPCPRCGGPHGPVRLEGSDLVASVTYAGDHAIVGVAPRRFASALGIDAEPAVDARRDAVGLIGVLGAGRPANVRAWTRVEATLKADGRGLRLDPALVEVTETASGWTARVPERTETFLGYDLAGAPPGILVSAALVPPLSPEEAGAAAPGRSRR